MSTFASVIFNPERDMDRYLKPLLMWLAITMLAAFATHARAAGALEFPVVDEVLCGFLAYSRAKLAPLVAAIVVVCSVVGHWLGNGKMWSIILYVGLGIGIVMGIGTVVSRYTSAGASCLVG